MQTRYRDMTEKYKGYRLKPDALYLSRTMQTLFNKFTRKGKKTTARRHFTNAIAGFRCVVRRPRIFNTIARILRDLRLQFLLLSRRVSTQIISVPVPARRNKQDIANIQTFAVAALGRNERTLSERIEQEMYDLTVFPEKSATYRKQRLFQHEVYVERLYIEKR